VKPSVSQILRSIGWSLKTYVEPEVGSGYAKSTLLTIDNLLRHVALRADGEAELLFRDNEDLRRLLSEHAARLRGDALTAGVLAAELDQVDAALAIELVGFPSTARLTDEAFRLRGALAGLQNGLVRARGALGETPVYGDARRAIRAYLAAHVERTAELVDPAFTTERR
jgi:hypothetical protein